MASKETIETIKEMRVLYKKLVSNSEHMKLEYELEQNKETMDNIRKYFARVQFVEEINKKIKNSQ